MRGLSTWPRSWMLAAFPLRVADAAADNGVLKVAWGTQVTVSYRQPGGALVTYQVMMP